MLGSALRNIDIVVIMQTLAGDLTKRMFTVLRGKGIGKFIAQLVSWVFFYIYIVGSQKNLRQKYRKIEVQVCHL